MGGDGIAGAGMGIPRQRGVFPLEAVSALSCVLLQNIFRRGKKDATAAKPLEEKSVATTRAGTKEAAPRPPLSSPYLSLPPLSCPGKPRAQLPSAAGGFGIVIVFSASWRHSP